MYVTEITVKSEIGNSLITHRGIPRRTELVAKYEYNKWDLGEIAKDFHRRGQRGALKVSKALLQVVDPFQKVVLSSESVVG